MNNIWEKLAQQGEIEILPKQICGLRIPCEIYTRVVGYYRPVKQWNPGKKEEYKDRREYIYGHTTSKNDTPSNKQNC